MSIQSDTEILSIQAMEAYAKKNHISGQEAIDIFHQYQVFEKIMIQHEYLHQVFIKQNRSVGGLQHSYDIVIGPVADDNTMETVQLYITGILSADEAVERLSYNRVNNQISFHTEKALESLSLVRRVVYE